MSLSEFLLSHPTYDECVARFGAKVFEYELEGRIIIRDGKVLKA